MKDPHAYYINGIGIVSPQKTFDHADFLTEITAYEENVLRCITPDFKNYINPIQLRRLNRMLRIGLTAATICLRDSNVQTPDGIITGTGYGFLDETAKFLRELLEQQEKQLTPTYFMQSTYNALAGLIALSVKCMGYNNTYVSKGLAFENALDDAMLQLCENENANYLVGAFDEAAEVQYFASIRASHFKTEYINSLELFNTTTKGSVQGEGAAFFMLSRQASETTWCKLMATSFIYNPSGKDEVTESLHAFLRANNITVADIDVWIDGASGDAEHDRIMNDLSTTIFSNTFHVRFKHLCGESCTASSFALWLGAAILKNQDVPLAVKVNLHDNPAQLKTVIIVNQYMNKNFSFYLLQK
ncbi:beta-ketoacyl synthase N-terminal-like domain-containing protein [Ohtaekwangia sp.]|uniref:beta-ketoacyl synthase N-terminal-like domain-containing protein n=1 Tax=Ohtaekwangia sp. TaxID=2066019 RepID=UPI002FDCE906